MTDHRRSFVDTSRSLKSRDCDCLPLLWPSSNSLESHSGTHDILQHIVKHLLTNIHHIETNLDFWQSKAETSDARKVYFMMAERGPGTFINEMFQLIRGSSMLHMRNRASDYMEDKVAVLSCLRDSLAVFLAQIYTEVDRLGVELVKDPEYNPPLLVIINELFLEFEASLGHIHAVHQTASSSDGGSLNFERFEEASQSTENGNAIRIVYQNLRKLQKYLSVIVKRHEKPSNITQHWIRYTCTAVGLSFCSVWLLRHSRLMGGSDFDDWIHEVKDSTVRFFNNHVEQPLLAIRNELCDTHRKGHRRVKELEEVQLASNSLRRMLLAFSEQTKGQKLPANTSEQEMLEIVMSRYEKEIVHPIKNLLFGELASASIIQVQKMKLDIQRRMLEVDQILTSNEINLAILAALPAFSIPLLLLMAVRAWLKQDRRAQGRELSLLLVEVQMRIQWYQFCLDRGMVSLLGDKFRSYKSVSSIFVTSILQDTKCMFGLILSSLDRVYHAFKMPAQATGEWQCVKQDIIILSRPGLETAYKLSTTSSMLTSYQCLRHN